MNRYLSNYLKLGVIGVTIVGGASLVSNLATLVGEGMPVAPDTVVTAVPARTRNTRFRDALVRQKRQQPPAITDNGSDGS